MDTTKYMVIAKGEIITNKIKYLNMDIMTKKYDITFNNGDTYHYSMYNVKVMSNPVILNCDDYIIETPEGKKLFDVKKIYQFENCGEKYWHIVLNELELDYNRDELRIKKNCLSIKKTNNTFQYLKDVSELSELTNDNNKVILKNYYDKISFISDTSALNCYLNNEKEILHYKSKTLIFPFGCNKSQYKAVASAMENQISIIEGPPGTGKTQTILNIIANLIISGKSVIIVSNNNQATQNVLEKLSKEQYGFGFMVATLGNTENKKNFILSQNGKYPNLVSWQNQVDEITLSNNISNMEKKLSIIYTLQEDIAKLKEEKYKIELEFEYFKKYTNNKRINFENIKVRKKIDADKVLELWQELQVRIENSKNISFIFKLKCYLLYGIGDWNFYNQSIENLIIFFQGIFYESRLKEISLQILNKEKELEDNNKNYEKIYEEESLKYLKDYIAKKYNWKNCRRIFDEKDLFRKSREVIDEYPIVISTTFSSRGCLNVNEVEYDYVIMDEASQVDIATGALALSCAKNAVIVGDVKQLPNVVTQETSKQANEIRLNYKLDNAYDFANKSFLQSIIEAIPNVTSTLLKEHYRCNPRIISFCNQKFYNNELIIMTEDDKSVNPLLVVKTTEGNHERDKYNQRQIDIIKNEILPRLKFSNNDIGIIAPYNNQVNEIKKQIPNIDVATVHKFQGREKDIIILSTVDDIIKNFTDDPYLLNVAVSRAKKKLIVVISGNEQLRKGNIIDLVSYIQHNNGELINSKINSIFDYLYSQYREKRLKILKKKNKISQYDSENLTYKMLNEEVLKGHSEYGVVCFQPLSVIVRDLEKLNEEEIKYVQNPLSHIDFIIYNKLNKQPVLAVETDGYFYHKKGTRQYERDQLKNNILEKCDLPLIRLNTNGSQEKEKILELLSI